MLDNNIKNQLKSHFNALSDPIELVIAVDEGKKITRTKAVSE
jgi:alkyl hydroperoxide reductase subunit F